MKNRELKRLAIKSKPKLPADVCAAVEEALDSLPEQGGKVLHFYRKKRIIGTLTATAAVITLLVLPNTNAHIAEAMEKLPILGNLFKAVTVREFSFSNDEQEVQIVQPQIVSSDKNTQIQEVNNDIATFTNEILSRFYQETDQGMNNSHLAVHMDYRVITNTEDWFTLRLEILETSASSDFTYKYYHINKTTGKVVKFQDLFKENTPYRESIRNDLLRQMQERMKSAKESIYWIDAVGDEWDFTGVEDGWNYYFSKKGDLVLLFNKYVVGPGQMGTPRFTISKEVYQQYLRNDIATRKKGSVEK